MSLTHAKVHAIRTAGLTDAHFARLYKVRPQVIRLARIGKTWRDHPTPPDLRPRTGGGRYAAKRAIRADDSTARHP